jgi:outer membrane protein assembly factor BamD
MRKPFICRPILCGQEIPDFNLDQSGTITAINELRGFINNNRIVIQRRKYRILLNLASKLSEKLTKSQVVSKKRVQCGYFEICGTEITNFQKNILILNLMKVLAISKVKAQYDLAQSKIESRKNVLMKQLSLYSVSSADKYPCNFLRKAEKFYDVSIK